MRSGTIPTSRKRLFAAGLATALIGLAGAGCIATTRTGGYMFSQSLLDQVPVGSSQEQVLVVMGTPTTTSTIDGDVFYYIANTRRRPVAFMNPKVVDQRVLAIYFDQNRKVSRLAEYGMQDGKVFDFIGRTTPTSGREQTLLNQLFRAFLGGPAFPGASSPSATP